MPMRTKLLLATALFFAAQADAQYCMLPGRVPYSTEQPGIVNFKLNTINRSSLPVESTSAVVVVTNDSTILYRGHTYTVTIQHTRDSVYFPTTRNNIRVWIDYNNNHSFDDAGETVVSADYQSPGIYTATFTVPSTAAIGTVHLRATAKMSSDAGHTIPTSCDSPADPVGYHGEMEDYKVKIMATTGVEQANGEARTVQVYPNPADNELNVAFNTVSNEPVTIAMYDASGRLVANLLNENHQSALMYTYKLDELNIARGVYFLKISSGDFSDCRKVIKLN